MKQNKEETISKKNKNKHSINYLLILRSMLLSLFSIGLLFILYHFSWSSVKVDSVLLTEDVGKIEKSIDKKLEINENFTKDINDNTTLNLINYDVKKIKKITNDKNEQQTKNSQISHLFLEDVKLQSRNSFDYYYQAPIMEYGNDSYLSITFSHSDLLLGDESSLTILIDNIPIKSIRLTSKNENYMNIKIPLDKKFLKEGFHKLSFSFVGSITEDECQDIVNPANWLILHQESFLIFDTVNYVQFKDMLKQFPYPFVNLGMEEPIQSVIVVPDQLSSSLLKAIIKFNHSISKNIGQSVNIPIYLESELTKEIISTNHVIAIGEEASWRAFIKTVIEQNEVQMVNDHMIMQNLIIDSPIQKQLLIVTASSDKIIEEQIRVFTNKQFMKQLSGNYLAISSLPDRIIEQEEDEKRTLEMLGTDDIILNSSSVLSQTLNLNVPSHWKVIEDIVLNLKLRISPLLIHGIKELNKENNQNIGLTILVNNKPFTIPLSTLWENYDDEGKNFSESISYNLEIPSEVINNRNILGIKFRVNMINNEINCIKIDDSSRWVMIEKESTITIPHTIPDDLNFENWPAPFTGEKDFANITFIPVGDLSADSISNLVYMIQSMGNFYEEINHFTILIDNSYEKISELTDQHLVFIGTKKELTKISYLKPSVVPYLASLEQSLFVKETVDVVSWLIPSIINTNHAQWVIANVNDQENGIPNTEKIVEFLLTNSKQGQILVESKSGEIIVDEALEKPLSNHKVSAINTLQDNYLILTGIFAVLGLGLFLFFKLLRKQRNF